jgi:pyrroloquinoline quinone biosynthesis protein D
MSGIVAPPAGPRNAPAGQIGGLAAPWPGGDLAAAVPEIASPSFRFQWEEAQGCHVLLYPEGMVKLNGSAGEILAQCDGRATVAEIGARLSTRFGGADLGPDIQRFLEVAHGNGWIRFAPPAA